MKRLLLALVASALLALVVTFIIGGESDRQAAPMFGPWAVAPSVSTLVLTPVSGEMTPATMKAADAWNEWEGYAVFIVGPGGIPIIWSWNLSMPIDGVDTPIAAGWFPDSRTIKVTTAYLPERDCLHCTLAHELGHVLGIPHGDTGPFGLARGPTEAAIWASQ